MVRAFSRSRDIAEEPRPANQQYTAAGTAIEPRTEGLPKVVKSICPECREIIEARLFEEDGKVWMEKTCSEHGYVKDLYWSDVYLYHKAERVNFGDGRGFSNPAVTDGKVCTSACGLCNMHTSATSCGNIDLTNRCNLRCPICFANADATGHVYEPSYEQVLEQMRGFREMQPTPNGVVQFSGGEPTIHPRFLDIIGAAKGLGFTHVQIATNGLRFLDIDFARAAYEAGLHTMYLQFDAVEEGIYPKTRGRELLADKMQIMENVRKAGEGRLRIVFVPTIVRGFNDSQVGGILECAIANDDIVSGISYQPVAFTGRISAEERLAQRYTLPDLALDIERQTGRAKAHEDWYPLACVRPFARFTAAVWGKELLEISCHPHCGLGTYIFIDSEGNTTPITQFIDVEGMLSKMDEMADKVKPSRFRAYTKIKLFTAFQRYFNPDKAPQGMSFADFLQILYGLVDKEAGRGSGRKYHMLLVAGMHFMDGYNYELERTQRCVIHYAAPDGRFYPFCTYNSGPTYRTMIEDRHSIPLEQYRRGKAGA